jgi:hypothetical protein
MSFLNLFKFDSLHPALPAAGELEATSSTKIILIFINLMVGFLG